MTAIITLDPATGKIKSTQIVEGDYTKAIEKPGSYVVLPVITVTKAGK